MKSISIIQVFVLIASVVVLIVNAYELIAQTLYVGAVSGAWNDAANWSAGFPSARCRGLSI